MAYYLHSRGKWRPYRDSGMDVRNQLPPQNYIMRSDDDIGLHLEEVDNFTVPARLYGSVTNNTDRIMRTFYARSNTTGVLLAGSKGSGKTLLAKNLSLKLAEQNVPTIIVNEAFYGDEFNEFLQRINQPCVVLFDEFEKVYMKAEQQFGLLTLLDGVFPTKKLFVLTCNDIYRVDRHMKNRPGRLFYMFKFQGLDREHVEEYCQDNLKDKSQIPDVCRLSQIFGEFNFDMLAALVEEMNRYNESAREALKVLNISTDNDGGGKYKVTVVWDGIKYHRREDFFDDDDVYLGSPLLSHENIDLRLRTKIVAGDTNPHGYDLQHVYFRAEDFTNFDQATNSFHFERDGNTLTLTKDSKISNEFAHPAF